MEKEIENLRITARIQKRWRRLTKTLREIAKRRQWEEKQREVKKMVRNLEVTSKIEEKRQELTKTLQDETEKNKE
ncbi:MAG: hypothetical protein ACFFBD_27325 [Candidatus Hodarchaeota archaeon]